MSEPSATGFTPDSEAALKRLARAVQLTEGFLFLVVETDAPRTALGALAWLQAELEPRLHGSVVARRFAPARNYRGVLDQQSVIVQLAAWLAESLASDQGFALRVIDASAAQG